MSPVCRCCFAEAGNSSDTLTKTIAGKTTQEEVWTVLEDKHRPQ